MSEGSQHENQEIGGSMTARPTGGVDRPGDGRLSDVVNIPENHLH